MVSRKSFVQGVTIGGALLFNPTHALSLPTSMNTNLPSSTSQPSATTANTASVAYQDLSLSMGGEFGEATVPVACWYPNTRTAAIDEDSQQQPQQQKSVTYPHRISVRRIGQMLARWDFIPEFVARDFPLAPTIHGVVDGSDIPLPAKAPVVLLAHGYLGSRYDLSHLAEALAAEGFVCFSPEYGESLAASYDRCEGRLDRTVVTNRLLKSISKDWTVQATSYGIVGHSLGCGTAIRTGDEDWIRVCLSGNPGSSSQISGKVLFVSSMNDGVVQIRNRGGMGLIPSDYVRLAEEKLSQLESSGTLPERAVMVFDRPDAPNHISFLSEGVNDAMVDFLSPLLPVAQALSIPVLDFDRYKESRDSIATAKVVKPLVTSYFKQHMKMV